MSEPQAGEVWKRNVPAAHFVTVTVRKVENGRVEFAPNSCWYDPNTTYWAKAENFKRTYTPTENGDHSGIEVSAYLRGSTAHG